MQSIKDAICNWIKEILVGFILNNYEGLFSKINATVGNIADEVGKTPLEWNSGVFSMINNISETVILPIAGIILTFVMCYELITMVIDKNNMHEFSSWDIFRWVAKALIAIILVSNVFNIVMAIFDVSQHIVSNASSLIQGSSTSINTDSLLASLESQLSEQSISSLLSASVTSLLLFPIKWILPGIITVILYGRMMEIYMVTSIAPIPFSTMANKEWGGIGQNYIKLLCALGFQAFLIITIVAIYSTLLNNIASSGEPIDAMWDYVIYSCRSSIFLSIKS